MSLQHDNLKNHTTAAARMFMVQIARWTMPYILCVLFVMIGTFILRDYLSDGASHAIVGTCGMIIGFLTSNYNTILTFLFGSNKEK